MLLIEGFCWVKLKEWKARAGFHRLEKVAFEVLGSRQESKEVNLQSINPKIRIRTHLAPENKLMSCTEMEEVRKRQGGGTAVYLSWVWRLDLPLPRLWWMIFIVDLSKVNAIRLVAAYPSWWRSSPETATHRPGISRTALYGTPRRAATFIWSVSWNTTWIGLEDWARWTRQRQPRLGKLVKSRFCQITITMDASRRISTTVALDTTFDVLINHSLSSTVSALGRRSGDIRVFRWWRPW